MPIIQPHIHRVLFWHDANQVLDFTTKDDVAAFTAAAALDDATPRILRIAGDSASVRDIAATISSVLVPPTDEMRRLCIHIASDLQEIAALFFHSGR